MAHWGKTPDEIKLIPPAHLELMETAFLLYERRQSETLDNLVGGMLGTSWDAAHLLGKDKEDEKGKPKGKKEFTWTLRKPKPKVYLPLTMALTQNPKFMEHLKRLASQALNSAREDASVLHVPKWVADKKRANEEVIDLSYVPVEEFKRVVGRFIEDLKI